MPLTAAFNNYDDDNVSAFMHASQFINFWNLVDIFMWFITGRVDENEKKVDMRANNIAR